MENKKGIIQTIGVSAIIAGTLSFIYGLVYHFTKGPAWYHIILGAVFLVVGIILSLVPADNNEK